MNKLQTIPNTSETIAMGFARRQTPESEFSHCAVPLPSNWTTKSRLDERNETYVVALAASSFREQKPGYREGVILIPVAPENFYSGVVQLKEGDRLEGEYKARREGEDPRKKVYKAGTSEKLPAKYVEIVLYHKDVLAEDGDRDTEADWEIVSINASPSDKPVPIPMGALIANHLHLSGGTQTNMTDEEFVATLRESVAFWKDKALVKPQGREA